MSKLDYAIDILEDDLNELRQMQAVPKHAIDGKLYIDRTKSLRAAIEKLKKANEASKPDAAALRIERGVDIMNTYIPVEINHYKGESTRIHRYAFDTLEKCQEFFNKRHKEKSGSHWGTTLCDYRKAEWKLKNGNIQMGIDHDGAFVEYICMKCVNVT
jgi:hypothetical protein